VFTKFSKARLCLHSGGDAGKEGSPRLPEAVICQGQLLCTPEAAEAAVLCCVHKIFKGQAGLCLHSGGDAGKEGSPRLPKAAVLSQGGSLCTPEAVEAAVLCQAGLRMASERLCRPPPGHAGEGQPELRLQFKARPN
jgi:hypothetical protein